MKDGVLHWPQTPPWTASWTRPFAIAMGKFGGLGVLNLDGINTRYDKPREVVAQIAGAGPDEATQARPGALPRRRSRRS